MPLANPLINGNIYDFASIEIKVLGNVTIVGVTEIMYKNSVKPTKAWGTSRQPIARTGGRNEPEASMTMYKHAFKELIDALGDGYMNKPFTVTVTYRADGMPIQVDTLVGCRITEDEDNHKEGADPLTVPVPLDVMRVRKGGLDPIKSA